MVNISRIMAGAGLVGLLGLGNCATTSSTITPEKPDEKSRAEYFIQQNKDKFGCVGVSLGMPYGSSTLACRKAQDDFAIKCAGIPEAAPGIPASYFSQGTQCNNDLGSGTAIVYCPKSKLVPCKVEVVP
ncbi:hypothetical protein HZC30_04325 [Candidatus Woesearchaeota archaeon]|nr:hypothetical protein [Candidatus Woesearchaeota archaeon]